MIISSPRRRTGFIASVLALAILPLIIACDAADTRVAADPGADAALIQQVMKQVREHYVEPVGDDKLIANSLKGMLSGLDPHSDYMDPRDYERMQSDLNGKFGGIGIELALQNGAPRVISAIDDTPAAYAGIDPGDVIAKIDTRSTIGMSLEEIVDHLRGPVGSSVSVEISRIDHPPIDVTLTRGVIEIVSVKSHLEAPGIGYVRIATFGERTPTEFVDALTHLKQQAHGHLKGLVLDLRNDPGGLLDSAVDVVGDLVDHGTVVTTRGRESIDDHTYDVSARGDLLQGKPVVVLVNVDSASAAEIVAGALQDHHRAIVMGTRSFGKGSVQTIIPMPNHGALRLTTARYYTPSGHSIQGRGIVPDIVVDVPKDEQVPNALIVREADLAGALVNTGSLNPDGSASPAPGAQAAADNNEIPIDPRIVGTPRDDQLKAAVKYLQGAGTPPHQG